MADVNDVGIHKRMRELANKAAGEARLSAQAAEQGAKLAARFEHVEGDYRSFDDMLRAQKIRLPIVLSRDHEQRNWGGGVLVAKFSRITDPYHFGSSRYYTEVDFFGHDNPDLGRFVLNEHFGAKVTSETSPETRKARRKAWPGIVLIPEEYTLDTVDELRDQLVEVLPVAKDTFNLLLTSVCDPALNPDLAEAAQVYRRDLLAGSV